MTTKKKAVQEVGVLNKITAYVITSSEEPIEQDDVADTIRDIPDSTLMSIKLEHKPIDTF